MTKLAHHVDHPRSWMLLPVLTFLVAFFGISLVLSVLSLPLVALGVGPPDWVYWVILFPSQLVLAVVVTRKRRRWIRGDGRGVQLLAGLRALFLTSLASVGLVGVVVVVLDRESTLEPTLATPPVAAAVGGLTVGFLALGRVIERPLDCTSLAIP